MGGASCLHASGVATRAANTTVVPESASLALFGPGLGVVGLLTKRRSQSGPAASV